MTQLGLDIDPGIRKLTLQQLSGEVARTLAGISRIVTEGEVTRPRVGNSGRVWFVLRDRNVQISVSISHGRANKFEWHEGDRVEVTGNLTWLAERGAAQLEAIAISPVGEGAIAAMISAIRERLRSAGHITRPRKEIPSLPNCVAVICGADAAVRRDIESVVTDRFAGYPVKYIETNVQGAYAVESICDALARVNSTGEFDVVILARGGGDPSALLPFSSEEVCLAIVNSMVPVVSAIGHENDRPLSDEVADLRCGTPSIAAAAIIPSFNELVEDLQATLAQAFNLAVRRIESTEHQLSRLGGMANPTNRLNNEVFRLDRNAALMGNPYIRHIHEVKRIEACARTAEALSPIRVLERGYSMLIKTDGSVVTQISDVTKGELVLANLAKGRIEMVVKDVVPEAK